MQLTKWIELASMNPTQFGKQVGISQPLMRGYLEGNVLPGFKNIEKIERFTGGAVRGEDILLNWLDIQRQRKENATAEGRHE